MANIKISELPAAAELTGSEVFPAVQDGETVGASVGAVLDLGYGSFTIQTLLSTDTTSGTAVDISVPSGTKRVCLYLNAVSADGVSPIIVQIGTDPTADGYETTFSTFSSVVETTADVTTGFPVASSLMAPGANTGTLTLCNGGNGVGGARWFATGTFASTTVPPTALFVSGAVSLPGGLTIVRITTVAGDVDFVAGTAFLTYEF